MEVDNLLSIIQRRRSTIGFKPDPISEGALRKILEAARWAPSGTNSQPWEMIVVRSPSQKKEIEELFYRLGKERRGGREYITQAPLLIIVCADSRTKKLYPARHGDMTREKIFISGVAAAIQNMLLAATALGLGSLWFTVGSEAEIQKEFKTILKIPEEIQLMFIVPVGFSAKEKPFRGRRAIEEFYHKECFDQSRLRNLKR